MKAIFPALFALLYTSMSAAAQQETIHRNGYTYITAGDTVDIKFIKKAVNITIAAAPKPFKVQNDTLAYSSRHKQITVAFTRVADEAAPSKQWLDSSMANCKTGLKKFVDTLVKFAHTKIDDEKFNPQHKTLFPNYLPKSVLTPHGWGGTGAYVFAGGGIVFPQLYEKNADAIIGAGVGYGNAIKFVNVAAIVNLENVHRFQDFTYTLVVNHYLPRGNSIAAGAMHLFANKIQSDVDDPSFYIAFSHAVQSRRFKKGNTTKLSYTIGIGNNRFYKKSDYDAEYGKGRYGTGVFASIAYEVIKNVNLNVEWTGLNFAVSVGFRVLKNWPPLCIGLLSLTRYSGDHSVMSVSSGTAHYFNY